MEKYFELIEGELSFLHFGFEHIITARDISFLDKRFFGLLVELIEIYSKDSKRMSEIDAIKSAFRNNNYSNKIPIADIHEAIILSTDAFENNHKPCEVICIQIIA